MFSALSHFVFGASSLFGSHNQSDSIKTSSWKDKKLCFDLRPQDLELNHGEQLIGSFYPIEDVKGNQDEFGLLEVTNLRLIWICLKKRRVNLSIGWRTVTMIYEQNLKTPLYGNASSLFVLSKSDSTKYEFVFARKDECADIWYGGAMDTWKHLSTLVSHLSEMTLDNPFDVTLKVWQAYKQTQLFRHCRSNINHLVITSQEQSKLASMAEIKFDDINRLPCENVIDSFAHVYQNESPSEKFYGILLLTNIRLIWIDKTIHARNLSIPYIRIESVKLRSHDRIVVSTSDYLTSSTHVEFYVSSRLTSSDAAGANSTAKSIFEQINNLHVLYKSNPRYGPESREDCIRFMSHLRALDFETINRSRNRALSNLGPAVNPTKAMSTNQEVGAMNNETIKEKETAGGGPDDDEIDRAEKELNGYATKLVNYLEERPLESDNELIFSEELGLAMEKPAHGASINSIWKIDV